MNFVGTGRRLAQGDVGDAARVLGIETAVLLAFIEVEAASKGFDGKNRPKMLFEPHVFWRNLEGALRNKAVSLGLAYSKWKPGAYPKNSYPRLDQAIGIARENGFRSASYGLPQILGENHRAAGFLTAAEMFSVFKQGEREQLLGMVALLKDWGLAVHLRDKDFSLPESWVPAVKRYNGAGYAANAYHKRAAAAYVKHAKDIDAATGTLLPPKVLPAPGSLVLLHGMKGEAVRNVQVDLQALGFKFTRGIDGRFGDETLANVRLFQTGAGLEVDGKVGDDTRKAIAASLAAKDEDHGPPPPQWPGQGDQPPTAPPKPFPADNWFVSLLAAIAAFFMRNRKG